MRHGPVIMHTLDFAGQHEFLRVLGEKQHSGVGNLSVMQQMEFLQHSLRSGINGNPPVPGRNSLPDEPVDFRGVDIIKRDPFAG